MPEKESRKEHLNPSALMARINRLPEDKEVDILKKIREISIRERIQRQ